MKVELHSITFEGDVPLTEIQLKSIDRLFDFSKISRIVVHVNCSKAEVIRENLMRFAESELSFSLCQMLVISADVSRNIAMTGASGWVTQQLLKLEAVAASEADWVIMLDAKNHFINRCGPQDFFSLGKAKINLSRIFPYWSLKANNARLLFGMPPVPEGKAVFPTTTPCVMHPGVMREMLSEHREAISTCLERSRSTEFFIYNGYLESRSLVDELYLPTRQVLCQSLFTVSPQGHDAVMATLRSVAENNVPVFGLHRNRIPLLHETERAAIRELWSPLRLHKDYLA